MALFMIMIILLLVARTIIKAGVKVASRYSASSGISNTDEYQSIRITVEYRHMKMVHAQP